MGKETDPFYGTKAWKRARRKALERDRGRCVRCAQAGRVIILPNGMRKRVPATMVHHIKPRKERPDLSLELSNLISLCDKCHDEAHPEKRSAARIDRRGKPGGPQLSGVRIVKI